MLTQSLASYLLFDNKHIAIIDKLPLMRKQTMQNEYRSLLAWFAGVLFEGQPLVSAASQTILLAAL